MRIRPRNCLSKFKIIKVKSKNCYVGEKKIYCISYQFDNYEHILRHLNYHYLKGYKIIYVYELDIKNNRLTCEYWYK